MKPVSIGYYIESIGNAYIQQNNILKKLITSLQNLNTLPKEFSQSLSQLTNEIDHSFILPENTAISEIDSIIHQTQKDIQAIQVQIRTIKSTTTKKGDPSGCDLLTQEKIQKQKEALNQFKKESKLEIDDLKAQIQQLKDQSRDASETMTRVRATIQASKDEFDTMRTTAMTEEAKEEMDTQVNDLARNIKELKNQIKEALQNCVTTRELTKLKSHQSETMSIMKNSIQNIKDEIKSQKLFKNGDLHPSLQELVESLQTSNKNLKTELHSVTQKVYQILDIVDETDDSTSNPISKRLNKLEESINLIQNYNISNFLNQMNEFNDKFKEQAEQAQKSNEIHQQLFDRLKSAEEKLQSQDELITSRSILLSPKSSKSLKEENEMLHGKIDQLINILEKSSLKPDPSSPKGDQANVSKALDELRSFQNQLKFTEQESLIYEFIDPTHLPFVVQSIDQVLNQLYSEMYQIRDQLNKDISELRSSIQSENEL